MNTYQLCDPPAHSHRWLVLGLVGVGTFMTTLDVSIVNVAMPTLTSAFKTSVATSEWFVLAYTFVITILLMTFGRLGDIFGRRRLYVSGILIFIVSSLLCGFSTSAIMLILARALQGTGSAILMSCGPAMVTEGFPATERGKALGFIGAAVALGLLAGPVIGGILVEYANWRWMFFLNAPIGLILITLILTRVQGFDRSRDGRLDVPGAVTMALSLAAIVFGLSYGERLGWTSAATLGLFGIGLALAALFIIIEKRSPNPMLDLRLFRNREFSVGAVTGWANYAAIMPVSVFLPFYLESVLGYRPDKVGLALACGPLTLALVAPVAGTLSDKFGSRALTVAGQFILAAGIFSMRSLTPESSLLDVIWRLALASLGSGLFVSPNSSSIMGSVSCENLGIASGTVALVRNLGMVSGVAIAGAIILTIERGSDLPGRLAFFSGLKGAFLASAIISLFGSVLSSARFGRNS